MTIPITHAIKAVRLHIAMCDAGEPFGYEVELAARTLGLDDTARMFAAARAGYKATLEYLMIQLEKANRYGGTPISALAAARPLVDHLDATRPNWRTE